MGSPSISVRIKSPAFDEESSVPFKIILKILFVLSVSSVIRTLVPPASSVSLIKLNSSLTKRCAIALSV